MGDILRRRNDDGRPPWVGPHPDTKIENDVKKKPTGLRAQVLAALLIATPLAGFIGHQIEKYHTELAYALQEGRDGARMTKTAAELLTEGEPDHVGDAVRKIREEQLKENRKSSIASYGESTSPE